jgi:hypothetical protein
MSRAKSGALGLAFGLLLGCFPTTTRPSFLPEPAAATVEVELGVPQATRALALALDADSIPVRRTEAKDGWLETEWFDARTRRPTRQRKVGPDVVKIRAWADPSRPNHSNLTVETVYRPVADPSRSDRELEQQVPSTHPIAGRVVAVTLALAKLYGGVTDSVIAPATPRPKAAGKPPIKPSIKPGGGG